MIECMTTGSFFTNSYIVSNDKNECVIVDPGLNYGNVAKYIKSKYDVKAILLTHAHLDHIDGIQYFLDTPVYISDIEYNNLFDNDVTLYDTIGRISPYNEGMLNIIKVKHNDIIKLIGYEFKVLFTPGHTSGSVCYLMDNVLFSGDTLFNNSIGRTDFPTGSMTKMKESLNYLMTLDDNIKVYPGHNDETTIGYEKNNNYWLK